MSREGDPFVSTSLEEAIRSINSAIDSTRRQLFDGWVLGAAGKTCQENNSFCCESQCRNPSGIYWDHLCLGQGLVTALWFLIYHWKGTLLRWSLMFGGYFVCRGHCQLTLADWECLRFIVGEDCFKDKCFWMKSGRNIILVKRDCQRLDLELQNWHFSSHDSFNFSITVLTDILTKLARTLKHA